MFTTNLSDMLKILFKLKEVGKTKNIGISNFNHTLVQECTDLGYEDIFCNQVEYHPYLNQQSIIEAVKNTIFFQLRTALWQKVNCWIIK